MTRFQPDACNACELQHDAGINSRSRAVAGEYRHRDYRGAEDDPPAKRTLNSGTPIIIRASALRKPVVADSAAIRACVLSSTPPVPETTLRAIRRCATPSGNAASETRVRKRTGQRICGICVLFAGVLSCSR